MQSEILAANDSAIWRQAYLDSFVDTSSEYFRNHIAYPRQFSDGAHYVGYLWDCFRSSSRITVQRFRAEVVLHPEVFVMADDHSRDRVVGATLWPHRPLSVVRLRPQALLKSLSSLPEDIYVFDSSVSWTLVLTHEHDGKRRICLAAGHGFVEAR